jgi:hypothetical protein
MWMREAKVEPGYLSKWQAKEIILSLMNATLIHFIYMSVA